MQALAAGLYEQKSNGGSALYEYNAIGNLTRKKEGTLDLTLNYPASGQGAVRPHAATSATFTGLGGTYKTLVYDANGNLDTVNGAESDYTFDAENRLKQRTHGGATTAYVYDANGTMVKRTTSGPSGSESTVYIGGIYEKNLTTGAVTKYYSAGGRPIAMRKAGTLSYLLSDHLGGTTSVLDAAGNVTASRKYWPYGAERSVSGDQRATDRWYTGQRDEDFDGLGLYNYKARFYSTTLGRFASADPYAGHPNSTSAESREPLRTLIVDESRLVDRAASEGGPKDLSRFAYAAGNPTRYVDPDGFCFFDPWTGDFLPCSSGKILGWLVSAAGGCSSNLVKYARTIVFEPAFRRSFELFNPWIVEMNLRVVIDPITLAVAEVGLNFAGLDKGARYGPNDWPFGPGDPLGVGGALEHLADAVGRVLTSQEFGCAQQVVTTFAPEASVIGGGVLAYTGAGSGVGLWLVRFGAAGITAQAVRPAQSFTLSNCFGEDN